MSAFISTKQDEEKVENSQYIRTANTPDEAGKPADPVKPTQPDAK